VAFLEQIVASQTPAKEIHIIADNLSAHRTSKVWEFLGRNRNVRIHYTPTYSSWLNQVENCFSKFQRAVIARGIFVSVKDLDRKLIRYIRSYNKQAKPFKWTYAETDRRICTTKKSILGKARPFWSSSKPPEVISRPRKRSLAWGHHVALSVVGTDRPLASGYFRAKMAQENLIKAAKIPFTIVRATQFFEFVGSIAQFSTEGATVRLPSALMRPIAADDVAAGLADVAIAEPLNDTVELAGPEPIRMDELVRHFLSANGDHAK
jgi:transposase